MKIYPLNLNYHHNMCGKSKEIAFDDDKLFYISPKYLKENLQKDFTLANRILLAKDKNNRNICHNIDADKAKALNETFQSGFLTLLKQKDKDGNLPFHTLATKLDTMSYILKDSNLNRHELACMLLEKNNEGQLPLHLANSNVSILMLDYLSKDKNALVQMLSGCDNSGKRVIDSKFGFMTYDLSLKEQRIIMLVNRLKKQDDGLNFSTANLARLYNKELSYLKTIGTRNFMPGAYMTYPDYYASFHEENYNVESDLQRHIGMYNNMGNKKFQKGAPTMKNDCDNNRNQLVDDFVDKLNTYISGENDINKVTKIYDLLAPLKRFSNEELESVKEPLMKVLRLKLKDDSYWVTTPSRIETVANYIKDTDFWCDVLSQKSKNVSLPIHLLAPKTLLKFEEIFSNEPDKFLDILQLQDSTGRVAGDSFGKQDRTQRRTIKQIKQRLSAKTSKGESCAVQSSTAFLRDMYDSSENFDEFHTKILNMHPSVNSYFANSKFTSFIQKYYLDENKIDLYKDFLRKYRFSNGQPLVRWSISKGSVKLSLQPVKDDVDFVVEILKQKDASSDSFYSRSTAQCFDVLRDLYADEPKKLQKALKKLG